MKLLFTRFPLESTHGGAEMQTISLMKGLQERGHPVAFLGSCPTLLVVCKQHDIPCAGLGIGEPPVTKKGAMSFLWRKKAMQKKLEGAFAQFVEHGLDAIYMLSLSEKILLTDAAVAAGVKVFWIEHDTVGRWLTHNPYRKRLQKLSINVTTIGVSELSAQIYRDMGWNADTTIGIPNGIEAERFADLPEPQKKDGHIFHIGTVARLAEEKGVDLLIEAIADIPNCKLTVVGVGPKKKEIMEQIKLRKLQGRVKLESYWGDIGEFYQLLDLFVLPSKHHDPYGLVAAEAMMVGTPTVVTDMCGIAADISDGSNGIICEANNATALRQAITNMMADAKRRDAIASAGKEKALEDFTVEKMIDRYEALLEANS